MQDLGSIPKVSNASWVTGTRLSKPGPEPERGADIRRLEPPRLAKKRSEMKNGHSPHQARLSGPSVPDSGALAQPLLAQTASKSQYPHLESRHYCPIRLCAAPSIRPKIPSRAARKTPVPSAGQNAYKARLSFSAALIRGTSESPDDQSRLV